MSFFGKQYTFVRHENFDKFLLSVGVSEEKAKAMENLTVSQSIVKNDDGTYTIISTFSGKPRSTTFTSGVELEDVIGQDNVPIKSTFTVDGNVVTQTISSSRGAATFTREFNGDDLVMTLTGDNFDGVAKRFYKA